MLSNPSNDDHLRQSIVEYRIGKAIEYRMSAYIEKQNTDGSESLIDDFLTFSEKKGLPISKLQKGGKEIITLNARCFKQVLMPDHQWGDFYSIFIQWSDHYSMSYAWTGHARIWISDGTSYHLKDCRLVEK